MDFLVRAPATGLIQWPTSIAKELVFRVRLPQSACEFSPGRCLFLLISFSVARHQDFI
jgi:hypothetical protein